MRPNFLYPISGPATDEQRGLALKLTRDSLTAVRDLCRELDLPADKLDLAVEIYSIQLGGIMQDAERVKHRARAKKLRAKYEAAGGGYRQEMMGMGLPSTYPGECFPSSIFNPLDFDDDED